MKKNEQLTWNTRLLACNKNYGRSTENQRSQPRYYRWNANRSRGITVVVHVYCVKTQSFVPVVYERQRKRLQVDEVNEDGDYDDW